MTHKKIAQLANVSASTVSKALSGSAEVNPQTAERIRRIAIELGYFKEKSKRKREYAKDGAFLIAVIVPEVLGYHYATIVTCIKDHVEARGGHVAVYIHDFNPDKSSDILQSIILHGGTDGVIMLDCPQLPDRVSIPLVCCSGGKKGSYDSIGCDSEKMIEDAVDFFVARGHKEIGYVGEPHTLRAADLFARVVASRGLQSREEFRYMIDARFEQIGYLAGLQILEQEKRPTAILAAYDEVAMGLIATLTQHGIAVPKDISVMGINNIPSAAHAQIPLTSVQTFSAEQYKMAVDVLFERIMEVDLPVRHITISHKIIERETTKTLKENFCEAGQI